MLSGRTSLPHCHTRNSFRAIRIEHVTPHVTRAMASHLIHARAFGQKPRSGRAPPHEVAEALYGTVNCGISVGSARAGAHDAGRHQRHRHSTGDAVARPVAPVPPQYYSRAAHMLRVFGKGGEHFVFRICSSLRVTGFVFADYIDSHGFHRFKRPRRFLFSGGKGQAALGVALSNAKTGGYVLMTSWDAGQERFVQKRTASE